MLQQLQLLLTAALLSVCVVCGAENSFKAGASIADITGPVADANTMGYAHASLSGLHIRQFCRSFVFRDSAGNLAAYAVVDLAMVSHLLSFTIGNRLSEATGGKISERNLMLCATHTHAGAGGFSQDLFLALNTPGFDRKYFNYIVEGVVQSVLEAEKRLAPARLLTNSGHLRNASVNRHPHQYLLNPEWERKMYPGNVDTEMHLLRIDNLATGAPIGSIAWFPVHGTSLKVSNRYVSGDNKGVASLLLERHFEPKALPGRQTGFVAAFPQPHSGDVTPNTWGVFRSTNSQGGKSSAELCNSTVFNTFECESKGPSEDQYESAMIIGRLQFETALNLHRTATKKISRPTVSVIHDVRLVNSEIFPDVLPGSNATRRQLRACTAAIGYAFCAGTADGKSLFSYFTAGVQRPSALIDSLRDLVAINPEDTECQGSKKICLNVGKIYWSGIPFVSSQIPTQILRLGSLFLVSLPTEITTMAGRRLIKSLSGTKGFPAGGRVQLNGLSNGYYFYVATEEEYNGSYYEAGATLYGPHTLSYYAWHLGRMMSALLRPTGSNFKPMQSPVDLDRSRYLDAISSRGRSLLEFDFPGFRTEFGQQVAPINNTYEAGQSVRLKFVACNPRNSFGLRSHSFTLIERYRSDVHQWFVVSTDAGLDTRFLWQQGDFFQGHVIITWDIPTWQRSGFYRVRYQGHCKVSMMSLLTESFTGANSGSSVRHVHAITGISRRFWVFGASNGEIGPEVSIDDLAKTGASVNLPRLSAMRMTQQSMDSSARGLVEFKTLLFTLCLSIVTIAIVKLC